MSIEPDDSPSRNIVTHQQRLARIRENDKLLPDLETECCRSCGGFEIAASPSDGDMVCMECGIVQATPIYMELHPFFWASRAVDGSSDCYTCPLSGKPGSYCGGSTYVRRFHFNEILACLTLRGPWIPDDDMQVIREVLQTNNIRRPEKQDIQDVCKAINKHYGVRRFSQKYSEKWIQIIFRFNGERPLELDNDVAESLRKGFSLLSSCWDDVSTLLAGSKDPDKRIQWPNYSETLYRIIRRKHPQMLAHIGRWIPRLSKKKRRDLKPFFNRLFYLVGWCK